MSGSSKPQMSDLLHGKIADALVDMDKPGR